MKNNFEIFWSGVVIKKDDRFVLTYNRNTHDPNYHLIDKVTKIDYLIDFDDVAIDLAELYQYDCLITFEQMLEMKLNDLIEFSWKSA